MQRRALLASTSLLFVLTSYAAAEVPGDIGTQVCRAAQLEAQSAVDSGRPYKNQGKLVSTAANVISAAEAEGLITEECSSCIVSQFARQIPTNSQNTCGPDLCEGSGAPGWQNQVSYGVFSVLGTLSPQQCCQACVDNPD